MIIYQILILQQFINQFIEDSKLFTHHPEFKIKMNTIENPQPTEQVTTLQDILDIELKICQALNIEIDEMNLDPPSFDLRTLDVFKVILKKIYNCLLKSPNDKKNHVQIDNSHTFESFEQKQAYTQIQDLLQKEQNKNRLMLKKQFEVKEYLSTVIDQLNQQKSNNRKINFQFSKLKQQIQQKTLQILHLKNMSKAFQRGTKDIFTEQKPSAKNKNTYHLSSFSNFNLNCCELPSDEKKIHTARQRQNSKSQMRKSNVSKQNALYALYIYHKQSVGTNKNKSNADLSKKLSRSQIKSGRKTPLKDMNSQELSNKRPINSRRKSEEIFKKNSSHANISHTKRKSQVMFENAKMN